MKYISIIILAASLFIGCGNWDRNKLSPFAVLELSKNEYNITFGSTHIDKHCILWDTILVQNTGKTPLIIDSITSSHPFFFWVEGGKKSQIIPANNNKYIIVSFLAHDYATEYKGEIIIYSNHTLGKKKIPITATLDCTYRGYSSCGMMGYNPGGGNSINVGWCSTFSVPFNQWEYSPDISDCINVKGFDIRIIAVDTIEQKITVEWNQHKDIQYETATVQGILITEGENNQTYPSTPLVVNSSTNLATFQFWLNPQVIKSTGIKLVFDTYNNGVRTVYYSPSIWMCI